MFAVLFEVQPKADRGDAYFAIAKALRPELEGIDGFVDNVRYRSLTRPGWLLSVSTWRDEKALVRWRTAANHHDVQRHGRDGVLQDYRLRVGEVTRDTRLPAGCELREQRLDETAAGAATAATLADARWPAERVHAATPADCAAALGLDLGAAGLVGWDVFEAVLTPGDVALLASWRDAPAADAHERAAAPTVEARFRRIRIVRDYGLHDRREAPQYYPPIGSIADQSGSAPLA